MKLTKEELIQELKQLEPFECMELIRDALERFYPGCKFEITSYHIPSQYKKGGETIETD